MSEYYNSKELRAIEKNEGIASYRQFFQIFSEIVERIE